MSRWFWGTAVVTGALGLTRYIDHQIIRGLTIGVLALLIFYFVMFEEDSRRARRK